ncbi:competence/damage-inducible protein A [Streptococcus fryi]
MRAEVIAVGTEILTGQIVNTNSQYLSEKCAEIGIDLYFHTAVGDNTDRLTAVLEIARQRSDLVILCGGLGPTEDDLTKQTLAAFLKRELVFDKDASQRLDDFFATRKHYQRTPNNERQAQIIVGSTPLPNRVGLAVGGLITVDGVTYVVLPGPPNELKVMVEEELLPRLSGQSRLYSKVLRFFGIGESQLVTILDDLIQGQTDPTIAPYAKTGEVTLRLSTKADSQQEADFKLDNFEQTLLAVGSVGRYCYGYGESNSLAQTVYQLLFEKQQTVTAAESLTGGLFQSQLVDLPGSSAVFKGGFVTYGIDEKAQLLGIPKSDLASHGVVSAWTARQMAERSRERLGTDFAISLTGVAGPDSLENKAVGTVFIGLASRTESRAYEVTIGNRGRSEVRHISCLHAFNYLRLALLNDGNLI